MTPTATDQAGSLFRIRPTPPEWHPLSNPVLPPNPGKDVKALETAWRKGAEALQSARATFSQDVEALATLASVADAMRQTVELRPRLAELLKAELQLRQSFPPLVAACQTGWAAEADKRNAAAIARETALRELLEANGWPVTPHDDLPHCKQVPDLFHRNADLARLRNAYREASHRTDQGDVLRLNDQAITAVQAELSRVVAGNFAGLAVIE